MKLNNIIKYGLTFGVIAIAMISCTSKGNRTGFEYGPQMYVSDAYEPFSQAQEYENNPNGMSMRLPVKGTIARGQIGYFYPHANTGEGYEASASYEPWVTKAKEDVKEGERLYNIYCWHCHGKKGKNDGPIFKEKKMPGPSWKGYQDDYIKNLPDGKIYHVVTYGKGLMGPHAFLISPEERWKVIHYVKYLSKGDDFVFDEKSNADELAGRGKHGSDNAEHGSDADGHENGNSHNGGESGFGGTKADLEPADKQMILTAMSKVMFKGLPNRKELKNESFEHLNSIAEYLKAHPNYKTNVLGHTGLTLTEEGAETLGLDRPSTIVNYLISKGVSEDNLRAISLGNNEMEGSGVSAGDRKANRRVELEIFK